MFQKSSKRSALKVDPSYLSKVSILICAYNEEKIIAKKIKNILGIEYPKDKLEIIVFDNGSEDSTFEIASSFEDDRLKVLKLGGRNRGKSAGINEALKKANGEIVKISDADCLYEKDILKKIVPFFADPSVGAVCLSQSLINPEESLTTELERSLQGFYQIFHGAESTIDSIIIGEGGLTFRRSLIDKIDENIGADDIDLTVRIRTSGHRVIYLKDAHYYEYTPIALYFRWKQKIKRSGLIIRALIRHRNVMFNRDLGFYGAVIYPTEFFIHVISPNFFIAIICLGIALFLLNLQEFLIASSFILIEGIIVGYWLSRYFDFKSQNAVSSSLLTMLLTFIESNFALFLGFLSLLWWNTSTWIPERSDTKKLETSNDQRGTY